MLAWGFARVRCPDCRHEYLLAFSCKQRCLCPSCHAKRQAAFGEFVTGEILAAVPHRHVVISLPRRLRPFFRRRKRLTRLARLAYETIKDLLQAAVGSRTAVPGAVACLQSAGNLLDWHPHVHLLVSWGLFCRDGAFIPVEGTPEPETVARLFRHRVLRMLLEEGAIEAGVVRNLLAWPHTGFGAHVSQAIPADATTPGIVARSMARPPITPERMLGEANKGRIIYRSDEVHPRHQANFRSAELATKPGVRSPGLPRRGERPPPRCPREDHALLRLVFESNARLSEATRSPRERRGGGRHRGGARAAGHPPVLGPPLG